MSVHSVVAAYIGSVSCAVGLTDMKDKKNGQTATPSSAISPS
jgi:hypothetical protein